MSLWLKTNAPEKADAAPDLKPLLGRNIFCTVSHRFVPPAMFIPDHKVEEIRAASDVVDIVSDYVRLKKRGSNYFGLCPFHNEKTPSFSVNPAMGIYKCFGCSKGGNVFQFVMEMESIGFPEAVRMLAERAHIPLPEQDEDREHASEIESI